MKNEYLSLVSSFLKNKRSKPALLAELEAHIEDKIAFYEEQGKSREEAEKLAVEAMGEPEQTAVSLNALHNKKWYKQGANIAALAVLAVIAALFAFFALTSPVYLYSDVDNLHPHRIAVDLMSLSVFTAFTGLLYFGFKKKNLFIIKSVFVFILIQVIFNSVSIGISEEDPEFVMRILEFLAFLKPLRIFEPMGYLFGALFTKGPAGYVGTLLTESYFSADTSLYYILFSFAVWILLLVVTALIWSYINRNIMMKPCFKMKKLLGKLIIGIIIFCAVYYALIGCCALAASFNKESINDSADSEFARLKSFALTEDLSSDRSDEEIIKDMEKSGFKGEWSDSVREETLVSGYMYNGSNGYLLFTNSIIDEGDKEKTIYNLTCGVNDRESSFNSRLRCRGTDFLSVKEGSKLESFIKNPLFDKAAVISRTDDSLTLTFVLESGDPYDEYGEATLQFTDGKLSYNSTLENNEEETFEIPPDATSVPILGQFN